MDKYIAEVCFGNRYDLLTATQAYNAKANKFQSALHEVETKYREFLLANRLRLGVETVDNFDNCTIKLKLLPAALSEQIRADVVALFNTIWSQ